MHNTSRARRTQPSGPRRLEWILKIICGLIKMGTMTATSLVYLLVLCCYLSVFVVPIPLQMQVRTTSVETGHPRTVLTVSIRVYRVGSKSIAQVHQPMGSHSDKRS